MEVSTQRSIHHTSPPKKCERGTPTCRLFTFVNRTNLSATGRPSRTSSSRNVTTCANTVSLVPSTSPKLIAGLFTSSLSVLGPRSGTEDRRMSVRMRTAWLNWIGSPSPGVKRHPARVSVVGGGRDSLRGCLTAVGRLRRSRGRHRATCSVSWLRRSI